MELDELKSAWQTIDRRLQQQNALGLLALRQGGAQRMRSSLRPLVGGQIIQMLVGVAAMLWLLPFWTGPAVAHAPWLLACGVVMHVYCIGLIVFGGIMLGRIASIDHAEPVVEIQRRLLTLRRTYVVGGMLIGLPWWFLTAPLLVVLTRGGIMTSAPSVIWIQLAIGAIGLLATWAFHRWANQPQRAALGRKLERGSAGISIRRAQAALDELARFERE